MTHQVIYPELKETTNAEIEFKVSYSSKYYLATDLKLSGRGIKQIGDGSNHKRGKKTYHVTELAMTKLKEKYRTCYIANL